MLLGNCFSPTYSLDPAIDIITKHFNGKYSKVDPFTIKCLCYFEMVCLAMSQYCTVKHLVRIVLAARSLAGIFQVTKYGKTELNENGFSHFAGAPWNCQQDP